MDKQTPPLSFQQLKQAVDNHFKTSFTVCRLTHDFKLVAMLCNVGQPYSPVTTWLYVAKDVEGHHYITKPRTAKEDVELMKQLTKNI